MTTAIYTALIWVVLLTGLLAAGMYLRVHRPRQLLRAATINADGWVIIIFLLYLRSVVLLALRGHATYQSLPDALVALGFAAGIDALLVYRVVSFRRFQAAYRAEQSADPADKE